MAKLSAKNEAFWALDKRNKRIAIAKDVIKWVEQRKLKPLKGTYVFIDNDHMEDGKLDKEFRKAPCEACGLGACFIAMVDLGNKTKVSEVFSPETYMYSSGGTSKVTYDNWIDPDKMREKLRDIFSSEQIGLIECAFEMQTGFRDKSFKGDEASYRIMAREAKKFGKKNIFNPAERLISIMKNIIKHRGTFRPDKP